MASTSLPCILTDSTGYYDLNPLYSKKDYVIQTPSNVSHLMNFCGGIQTSVWGVEYTNKQGVYYEGSHGGISLGQYNTTISNFNGVLSLMYTGGSTCPISAATRSSIIQLQCSTRTDTSPIFIGSINDCAYFYTFSTPFACPGGTTTVLSGVGTALWVFFSFILVAAMVSLGSAVVYNRLVLKKRGSDQFPSIELIRDGIAFVQDMAVIVAITVLDFFSSIYSKFNSTFQNSRPGGGGVDYTKGAWSRSARNGFDPISTTSNQEEEGRKFLDEEEEDS